MGKVRFLEWGCLLALAVVGTICFLHRNVKNETLPEPLPPTEAAGPLAGLRVCLDAGHGGYDGGAYGRDSGTPEKELNLDVARRLADLLSADGAEVVMTRTEDTALADEGENRKRRDLQRRVDCAAGADLFLSIHMNEYRTRSESGPQVFYRKGQGDSRLLAGALQERLNADLVPDRPRSANTGDYYLLRNLDIPAVLVECWFLSNAAEEQKLLTPAYRQAVAQSLRDGILAYLALAQTRAGGV